MIILTRLQRKLGTVKKVRIVAGRAARGVVVVGFGPVEGDRVGGVAPAEEVLQGRQAGEVGRGLVPRRHVVDGGGQGDMMIIVANCAVLTLMRRGANC